VKKFYNLKDFEIRFDDAPSLYNRISLRFFVGENGSGKSKALEALSFILAHLAINRCSGIEYDLEYEHNGQQVRITTQDTDRLPQIHAAVFTRPSAQENWERVTGWGSSGANFLPGYIVGYSTGPTSGLPWTLVDSINRKVSEEYGEAYVTVLDENESEKEREERQSELAKWRDAFMENSRTLYFGADDALLAVLPLLAHEGVSDEDLYKHLSRRRFLSEHLKLDLQEPLAAFSLLVSAAWSQKLSPHSEKRFQRLLDVATVLTETDSPVFTDIDTGGFERFSPKDFYAVFDLDEVFRRKTITDIFRTPLAFFQDLLVWKRQGVIQQTRLILKKADVDPLLPEYALSDGEYLYLGRYALLLMLREVPECLILLDEPETHFNDRWKMELVKDICKLMDDMPEGASRSEHLCEIVIATHSDLTLADADKRQVYVFEDGKVNRAPISPFAADRNEITQAFFNPDDNIESYADTYLDDIIARGNQEEIEQALRITGPGFARFQLRNALAELRGEPHSGGDDATSPD
jgi:predicted ATPase